MLYTEKALAIHSSTLAWKPPRMEEPGGLQSMGSLRVGHNFTFIFTSHIYLGEGNGRQPTPVFLPGEFHGQRSLAGYSPWGHKESDKTKRLTHALSAKVTESIQKGNGSLNKVRRGRGLSACS